MITYRANQVDSVNENHSAEDRARLGLVDRPGAHRVYLGVHFPSDVFGGWLAGLGWAMLCWLVARYLQRKGAVEGKPG